MIKRIDVMLATLLAGNILTGCIGSGEEESREPMDAEDYLQASADIYRATEDAGRTYLEAVEAHKAGERGVLEMLTATNTFRIEIQEQHARLAALSPPPEHAESHAAALRLHDDMLALAVEVGLCGGAAACEGAEHAKERMKQNAQQALDGYPEGWPDEYARRGDQGGDVGGS